MDELNKLTRLLRDRVKDTYSAIDLDLNEDNPNKEQELLNGLISGNFMTDGEAAHELYGTNAGDSMPGRLTAPPKCPLRISSLTRTSSSIPRCPSPIGLSRRLGEQGCGAFSLGHGRRLWSRLRWWWNRRMPVRPSAPWWTSAKLSDLLFSTPFCPRPFCTLLSGIDPN